MYMNAR